VEPGADQADRPRAVPGGFSCGERSRRHDAGGGSLDEGFDFGVHWVLDGIEALEECTEYAGQDGTSSHVDRQNG